MEKVHTVCRFWWKHWKSGISVRRDKRYLMVGAFYALVYLGIAIAAACFTGVSAKGLALVLLPGILAVGLYLVDIPLYRILHLAVGVLIPLAAFLLMEQYTHELSTLADSAPRLNLILYYLLYGLLFFALGNLGLACTIGTAFIMICGITNYFVVLFRSGPIVPWDFYSIGTAMSVADNYTFSIDYKFAIITACLLALILISLRLDFKIKRYALRFSALGVGAIVGGWFLAYLWNPDTIEKEGLNKSLFVSSNMYQKDGFLLAFTINLRYLNLEKPDGYDRQEAENLLASHQPAEAGEPDELPNVVVVMSETFSDLAVLGEFDTNMDYMPFIHTLLDGAQNTISGNLYVSVLGGNTANSEFEFLTGNTMKFFPTGSVPYQQYIHSDVESVVDQFNDMGYETFAMHPYREKGWNRNKIYPLMHFDDMKFINDITYKDKLRVYVSDESNYKNVISELEQEEDPMFMFNVTMQNHSAYGGSYDNFIPQITAQFQNTKSNKYLNNYLSLIFETDQATEEFLEQLKELDEPTIVLFFGDHQPNDYVVKPIYKEHGMDIEAQTIRQQQNRQITPFFIWANYDIEEQSGVEISANYLCNLLMKTAGFELSPYQTYLEEVAQTFPVLNAVGYFDAQGNCKSFDDLTPEEQSVLDTYEKVQYYRMFDK